MARDAVHLLGRGRDDGRSQLRVQLELEHLEKQDSVQTDVGNTVGLFSGCWLTMEVPSGGLEPDRVHGGSERLVEDLYSMAGNGTSSDVTTRMAQVLANPVHLVVP
jgi:hypothetical protein